FQKVSLAARVSVHYRVESSSQSGFTSPPDGDCHVHASLHSPHHAMLCF
ncbi:uncharacterized, partial [Tachysurus ichikawai]